MAQTGMENLIPGGNPGGSSMAVPSPGGSSVPSMGSSPGPFQPQWAGGVSMPSISAFPADFSGGGFDLSALTNLSPAISGGLASIGSGASLDQGFHAAGYPSGVGNALGAFLAGGAGYNPQVAQALLAALGPTEAAGQANIMEQFSSMGLGAGSPAALGLSNYASQEYLDAGQILSQLYQQSVQNYMQTLLAAKQGQPNPSSIGSIIGGAGSLASGLASLNTSIGQQGVAGSGGSATTGGTVPSGNSSDTPNGGLIPN